MNRYDNDGDFTLMKLDIVSQSKAKIIVPLKYK